MPQDSPPTIEEYVETLAMAVKDSAARHMLPLPQLILEPGRSIVGPAGITLLQVGSWKTVPGGRKYVAADGGMMSDLRPALYGARYHAIVANRPNDAPQETVTIAGKACESGDILIRDIRLPKLQRGDLLGLLSTGAYHYSMASNYNHFCRPAVVFAYGGRAELVVARESYADLSQRDIIPPHLLRRGAISGA